ncbi:hypothetical protein QAD02_004736 [Eretmocerus hayati]|uniref:Uncharacterized protein n=1 Tax=Eretmocerus hayati TaxID=131215 RepID=A0ACC2NT49_9HYME|nr:hypothetical protein QAD02_004736 [Eretmocerus hayati]
MAGFRLFAVYTAIRDLGLSGGTKKFGDDCKADDECGFDGAYCDPRNKKCFCREEFEATNHIDKCGNAVNINGSCFFTEQCELTVTQTECRDNRCICIFEKIPVLNKDGSYHCVAEVKKPPDLQYVDPAMIIILSGMILMFIIICVVLRLFSKARWNDNRTIFNTPNARLMNVSLLKEKKLLHGHERRGSRASVRLPSRQPSMASLRAHSPNASQGAKHSHRVNHEKTLLGSEGKGKRTVPGSGHLQKEVGTPDSNAPLSPISRSGSRRGSRGSSSGNTSALSAKSTKSPPNHQSNGSGAPEPVFENVTVEIVEDKS